MNDVRTLCIAYILRFEIGIFILYAGFARGILVEGPGGKEVHFLLAVLFAFANEIGSTRGQRQARTYAQPTYVVLIFTVSEKEREK